ncbi:hypothetical protein MNBD_GAMMA15-647 [hydrothermal vent metagenome]|uniref:Methyltransferase FkbM domain-containing protein n=1 Tax=hydrothermal vent metagenome TaxID=652676 RepID=A0A3B0XY08_9ZZZZ
MLSKLLNSVGLYQPLRILFYKLFRAKTPVEISGIHATFYSSTPDLYRRIVNFGGEREQIQLFLDTVQPGETVWDIGSFIGMFTVLSSKRVGEHGQVIAFEPEPDTYKKLLSNCKLNQCNNVTVFNAALSDTTDEGMIFSSREHENAIHSLRPNDSLQDDGIPTQLYSAAELVRDKDVPVPNAVKLDVEGAECLVMNGMKSILADDKCRFLFMEVHPDDLPSFGHSLDDVHAILEEVGFPVTRKYERGSEYHYFCEKP